MFPLAVRSHYSLLQGTASPARLCRLAKTHGYSGLALTDRDNLYGLWPFLAACRREGIRPLVGALLSESDGDRLLTCLVRSDAGYANLCRLLSLRHGGSIQFNRDLAAHGDGLIFLGRDQQLLAELHQAGVEVAADLGPRPTAAARLLRQWAMACQVTAVASPDSSMAGPDELDIYRLLRAIARNTSLSRLADLEGTAEPNFLEAPEVYRQRFAVWPEVVAATVALAERCTFSGPRFGTVMPPWRGGAGQTASAGEVLRREAYAGACRRYGDDLGEPVVERLEHELRIIELMNFSSYFLVVRDIVHRRGADGEIHLRRICGRGSGAASLVAYCLAITNVCPIRYNLYFERFLNPGRQDPPDIDIDFAWDERDEVLRTTLADFAGHAAMVCNHVCFQPRMAIRETAKAFGLPGGEISQLTRRMPWLIDGGEEGFQQQLQRLPTLKDQDFAPPWPEILALAARLLGIPRYLSVHPGGIIITPRPIVEYVPIELAAKGVPIIQWEKDGAEEAGLVKIDLLGNRSLGVIRDSLAAVRERGIVLDELTWQPEDDALTRSAVARGTTMGCFYIESPAMRLLEQKAASGDFGELVIQSSIIRPAANEFVREYVRRLHGGAWQPLHPAVGDILDESYGLMVYQEDVSRVAVALAGFSHADGDGLRKILSKKDKEIKLADYRSRFYQGCRERGVDEADIDRVWQMMMSFDGYSFCKPHSASYARVSFQAAWLKHHFPAEFMAAVIANEGGYYSTFAYVSEAKRMGIAILPPEVNRSAAHWLGREGRIRVGLRAVRGLSERTIAATIAARRHMPFAGVGDFFSRVQPDEDEARALIHAGAFDLLDSEANRTRLLWQLACWQRSRGTSAAPGLFPISLPEPPPLPPPDQSSRLQRELEVLGFLCKGHPLSLMASPAGLIRIADLPRHVGRRIRCRGWLLTGKLVSTRGGETMEFLTFEDESAIVETTFFPEAYRRHAHLLQRGGAYLLSGLVEEDFGAITLTVAEVHVLKRSEKPLHFL